MLSLLKSTATFINLATFFYTDLCFVKIQHINPSDAFGRVMIEYP